MIFLIALLFIVSFVSASDYCVNPTVSDISPSSVGINEEFTVGILLDNCGDLAPKSISFELKDVSPDIYVQEPLIREITDIGYVADRFLLYHMKTSENIKPGEYSFRYKVKYSGEGENVYSKEGYFQVNVIGDNAELSIASVKTDPVLPREKDKVELTLRIENFGDGTANAVKVWLEHPFAGIKESFIGTLESDEDGPAVFTFVVEKKGEYNLPVKISYKDDFGEKEVNTEINLYVSEGDSNFLWVLISLVIIGAFAGLVVYLFKVKKSKDKVIQQLLRGNSLAKKNHKPLAKKNHKK